MPTVRKFPAICRYCVLRIGWNKTHREWDRSTPNKTVEGRSQYTWCHNSPTGWHDPDPRRA